MATYVFYDDESGDVLHVHAEPPGLDTTPEEMLRFVGRDRERRLSVLPVDVPEALRGRPLRIDLKQRQIIGADDFEVGMGDAGVDVLGISEPNVERTYTNE